MAADFRLVAHAAQRDARELAAQRVGHTFAERGFADARRADQTKNRPFDLLPAFDHREKFEEALLDFRQTKVLFVQNALGFLQINLVLGFLFPRQVQNPVEVIARDRVFGGGGRRQLQALQFQQRGLAGFVGHRRLVDFFAQRPGFAAAGFAFAQFALNGAQLFAQEKVALRLGDGRRNVVLNFGAERQHLVLAVEHGQQFLQTLADGNGFQQLLPVFEAEIQIPGNEVGEMAGMFGVQRRDFDLVRERGRHLGDFLKLLVRVAQDGLQLDGILRFIAEQFVTRGQIRRGRRIFRDANAPQPLNQHARGAVGKFHHFHQPRDAADFVQILRLGLGDFRPALQHHAQQPVARHHVVNQIQARPGLDEQRYEGAGKDDDVRQAENRQRVRQRTGRDSRGRSGTFGAQNADKFCLRRCHRRFHQFLCLMPRRRKRIARGLISLGNRHLGHFGVRLRHGHVNPQKTVHINGLGLAEIVTRRQFEHTLKRPVTDLHHQKIAFAGPATIRPGAGNAEAIALHRDFKTITFHASQFHLDDQTAVRGINVRIGNPMAVGCFAAPTHRRAA